MPRRLAVHADALAFPSVDIAVSSVDVAVVSGSLAVSSGDIAVVSGSLAVSSGDVAVVSGSLAVSSGSLAVSSGDVAVSSVDLAVSSGSLAVTSGGLAVTSGPPAPRLLASVVGDLVDHTLVHFKGPTDELERDDARMLLAYALQYLVVAEVEDPAPVALRVVAPRLTPRFVQGLRSLRAANNAIVARTDLTPGRQADHLVVLWFVA